MNGTSLGNWEGLCATFCIYVSILSFKKSDDAEFKGKEPISLVEDTCLQAVAWLLIAVFNQIFSED